VTKRELRFRKA